MPSKECPLCRLVSPLEAEVCDCGYSFAHYGHLDHSAGRASEPKVQERTAVPVDLSRIARMPFTDYFLAQLNRRDAVLYSNALTGLALTFGNDPAKLETDAGLIRVLENYLKVSLFPYVMEVAIPVLGLVDVTGTLDTESVATSMLDEAQKAKDILFPVQEVAEAIFGDDIRAWCFFKTVVVTAAMCFHESPELATMCGFKKTALLGKWKPL